MIRRNRQHEPAGAYDAIEDFRERLLTRRRLLIEAAGGSLALLFSPRHAAAISTDDSWQILSAVLEHLLPSEPDAPGAKEIQALRYFRFVVADERLDQQEREFILRGVGWLNQLSVEHHQKDFTALSTDQKESLLRQIAKTAAGENWISTLLSYLFEALLTAPAYGGNPDGIGWRWLQIVPGFPLPAVGTRYTDLPL